jgi:S-formylglutathione hydrolase FrmB
MHARAPRLEQARSASRLIGSALTALAVTVTAAAAGIAFAPAAAGAATPSTPSTPRLSDGYGLHVVSQRRVNSRLLAVTLSTRALYGRPKVDILLPAGYSAAGNRRRRYPVLYLLPGTSGTAADWVDLGDAEQASAGLPMIIVSPDIAIDGDGGGWCTNWWNRNTQQTGGVHDWETFHIDELIPWIDHNLRTRADRQGRAIAGLSQGGFCSMSYAARYPDLFGVALAYSGAPDIAYNELAIGPSTSIINFTETVYDHVPANSMFGPRATEELNWANHDPATLAPNLRDTKLLIYAGNGQPGPLAGPGCATTFAEGIESLVGEDTTLFHNRLVALGIPSVYDAYGPGTHCFAYWARDLKESVGAIARDFAHPLRPPRKVTYTIADPSYSIYGWHVTMHRLAEEFSTLENADARGFALSGSGSATVTTPPVYVARAKYRVTLHGPRVHRTIRVKAGADRRLRINLPLGPANRYQQYSAAAQTAGTAVFTTGVAIRRSPRVVAARPQALACSAQSRYSCQ